MKRMFIGGAMFVLMATSYAQEVPQLLIDNSWTLKLPYLETEMQNGKKAYNVTLISKDGGITFVVDTDSIQEVTLYEEKILSKRAKAMWNKATIIPSKNPDVVRQDACGAKIKKAEYGCRQFQYGWEIDHIQPKSKGGSDKLSNLQPLHWKNNATKSNNWPNWDCEITLN